MIEKMKKWHQEGNFNGTIYGNYIYVNGGTIHVSKQESREWKRIKNQNHESN